MANIFKIGVINSDHTNRHVDLNRPLKLATGLHDLLMRENTLLDDGNRLVTISEFGKTAWGHLKKQVPTHFDSYGDKFPSKDFMASFWEEGAWKVQKRERRKDVIWSDPGKYAAVVLENENINKRVLYVSVHLPNKDSNKRTGQKGMKDKSYKLLQKLIKEDAVDEKKYNADATIIAGDFNMNPTQVFNLCGSQFRLGIASDKTFTTKKKRSIDNIVTSDAMTSVVKVYKEYDKLEHYPLIGTLTLED